MPEHIHIGFRIYPSDATFILHDSLHSRGREFLIEGDGWKKLSALGLTDVTTLDEDHSLYAKVHDIFLTAEDYEVIE